MREAVSLSPSSKESWTFSSCSQALGVALVLFSVFRGPLILWEQGGTAISPAGSFLLIAGLVLTAFGFAERRALQWEQLFDPKIGAFGLALVFASDWLTFRFNLFQGPSIRGELLVAFLGSLFLMRTGVIQRFLPYVTFSFPVFLFLIFLQEAYGRQLFSDDHTAVFYRLSQLLENFPHIPFYNPLWNGGMDARDFFATGILNFYFLFYPALKIFGLDSSYAYLVGIVVFLFLPLFTYWASRLHGLSYRESGISVALSLASSLLWYRWCLKYGAMGFVVSSALLPVNLALVTRLLKNQSLKKWEWISLLLCLTMMFFWTLSLLVFAPLGIYVFACRRQIFFARSFQTFFLAFLVLNLPWVIIFLDSSKVLEFLKVKAPTMEEQAEEAQERIQAEDSADSVKAIQKTHTDAAVKGRARAVSGKAMSKAIRNFATNSNPLLLFLALPGIFLLPERESRRVFVMVGAWLLFLGAALAPTLPQLELERMLVILSLVLAVPVGCAISRLLNVAEDRAWKSVAFASIPLAFLLVGGSTVGSVIRNRSLEKFHWADGTVSQMVDTIRNYGGSGRVVFTGFVLHELSQGHLAPLAYWTNHPLVASSPFHNRWKYTNVIPASFMDSGPEGAERYFDIMNATSVLAHEREWRQYFASRPEIYHLVGNIGRFQFFTRNPNPEGYFLEGKGEILEENSNQIKLRLEGTGAILKFVYFPFLKADGCQVRSFSVAPELDFIRLEGCPSGATVTIESVHAIQRLRS